MTLASALLAGCNGPTKSGVEARENARERLDTFNAQFAYDTARQEFESGQFDRALHNISVAAAQAPEVGECDVLKGRIFIEMHELESAIMAFNDALEKDPELSEAHYYIGIVQQRWTEDEAAYESYRQASELDETNVQYLLATAESLITLGELDEAQRVVEARMNYFEFDPALRLLLAQIALLNGETEKAVRLYGDARLLDPDNDALLEELVWTQYDAGHYAGCYSSLTELKARIDDSENRLDLLHVEAGCLSRMGRSAEAHRLYMELTDQNPSDPSIWVEFGTLAWELNDQRRLKKCGDQVISLAPDRYEGYLLKGVYEREAGRMAQAVDLFREATSMAPDVVLPQLMLGSALEESGDTTAALAAYSHAVRLAPEHREARMMYDSLEQRVHAVVPTSE
jgi:tetratricopeptide (TPR) repeat protein